MAQTRTLGGKKFEQIGYGWVHTISKRRSIVIIEENGEWIAKEQVTGKSGSYIEGTKEVKTVNEFRSSTLSKSAEGILSLIETSPSVKASAKYNETNVKQVKLALNKKTDADIIEKLESVDNIQGYIKKLIREDIK